jgi:hypothetical protein
MPYRDDDHEVLHPREFPDPGEPAPDLLPCPHCLGVISEVSQRCPHCGNWLSEEDAPYRKPWWVIVGALICLATTILWIFL